MLAHGWYKRRLPLIEAPPSPALTPAVLPPALVHVPFAPHAGQVVLTRLPSSASAPPPAGAPRPWTVRNVTAPHRAVIARIELPAEQLQKPLSARPLVVRSDREWGGLVFRQAVPLKPPLTGSLLPARCWRSDYQRAGLIASVRPPSPRPASIAGGILPPWTWRSDYRRVGKFFAALPPMQTPPAISPACPPQPFSFSSSATGAFSWDSSAQDSFAWSSSATGTFTWGC